MTKSLFSFTQWESRGSWNRGADLVLASMLGLFLEILLIRWLGSEIRLLAYFKNFTLISCFFGLGLGFILAKRGWNSFALFPVLLCALVLAVSYVEPRFREELRFLPAAEELHAWALKDAERLEQAVLFYCMVAGTFLFLTFVFVPVGQLTGRLMNTFRPLRAYSLNLVGSVLGIAAFSLLSFVNAPPSIWMTIAGSLALVLARRPARLMLISSVFVGVTVLSLIEEADNVYWSPYQKIEVDGMGLPVDDGDPSLADGGYVLSVNQAYHQRLLNLSPEYLARHGDVLPFLRHAATAYLLPYLFKPEPENVLILGAGSGNDVASALRHGAKRVVAVEIDPLIVQLGRELHPEQPYASPHVEVWSGDARSFIQREKRRFDLIVYGLVDSHTLLSSRSEVRLDNFLYTAESFRGARSLLAEDGVMAVTFSIHPDKPWIETRIFFMLEQAFGEEPLCRASGYDWATTFVVGAYQGEPGPRWRTCRERISRRDPVPPATDDWPFLYLKERTVPEIYFTVIGTALVLSGFLLLAFVPEARRLKGDFFFLGAAFMLIEVKAVTELALIFGTTWFVNAVAVLGILGVALAANLWVEHTGYASSRKAYLFLAASIAIGYLLPQEALLRFSLGIRGPVAALLLCAPVFFAGVIFSTLLRRQTSIESAFASNLFGAMFGGFAEYSSLVFGIKSLYLIAALLYGLSFVFARQASGSTG